MQRLPPTLGRRLGADRSLAISMKSTVPMRRLPALTAMKIFEVAGQTGSFTRAAEKLNLTQSAVSRQVRHLEEQIGETLMIRRHHRLELTPAGAQLLEALNHAFHHVEFAVRSIQEKSVRNRLRINLPPTFARRWFMPRLKRFRAAHPGLDISIGTALADTLSERGLLDCAVRFGDGEWASLSATHLMTERHVAVAAPSLVASWQSDSLDLSGFTFLHVLASDERRYLTWRHWLGAAGFPDAQAPGGLEFDRLDLAIEAAVDGIGITVADLAMVERELAAGVLVKLNGAEVSGHQSYWLVTRPDEAEPGNVALLRDFLRREIAASDAA